jgi:hypothetical protein
MHREQCGFNAAPKDRGLCPTLGWPLSSAGRLSTTYLQCMAVAICDHNLTGVGRLVHLLHVPGRPLAERRVAIGGHTVLQLHCRELQGTDEND